MKKKYTRTELEKELKSVNQKNKILLANQIKDFNNIKVKQVEYV